MINTGEALLSNSTTPGELLYLEDHYFPYFVCMNFRCLIFDISSPWYKITMWNACIRDRETVVGAGYNKSATGGVLSPLHCDKLTGHTANSWLLLTWFTELAYCSHESNHANFIIPFRGTNMTGPLICSKGMFKYRNEGSGILLFSDSGA